MRFTVSLVLFLLMLSVPLLALESEPSETVGYVKYECKSNPNGDYNLIALALDAGYTLASELGADYPFITSIRQWDQVSQIWVSSDNFGGGFWFPDNPINPNEALLITINTSEDDVFVAGGLNTPASYNFVTNANGDYNTMMLPFEESALTNSTLLGEDIGVCTSIRVWDNIDQNWVASDNFGGGFWFPEYDVDTGFPYYITVSSNITWPSTRGSKVVRDFTSKVTE